MVKRVKNMGRKQQQAVMAKLRSGYFAKKGISVHDDRLLPKSAKEYKNGDRMEISTEEPLYGPGGANDRIDGKKGKIVDISKDKPRATVELDDGRTITIAKGFLKYKPLVESKESIRDSQQRQQKGDRHFERQLGI